VLLLCLFFAAIWYAAHRIVAEFPRYADDLHRLWEQALSLAEGWGLPIALPGEEPAPAEGGQAPLDPITGFALGIVNSVWRTLTNLVLIFFFVLLMLIEAPT
jgi:predicted PurR-regulated permease PerM